MWVGVGVWVGVDVCGWVCRVCCVGSVGVVVWVWVCRWGM